MSLQEYGAPPNVFLHRRIVPWRNNWLITLTLINTNPGNRDREISEINTLFQVRMKIAPGRDTRLIARPSRRMNLNQELAEEERTSALLYRNTLEYAVGHTCSADWTFWMERRFWTSSLIPPGLIGIKLRKTAGRTKSMNKPYKKRETRVSKKMSLNRIANS